MCGCLLTPLFASLVVISCYSNKLHLHSNVLIRKMFKIMQKEFRIWLNRILNSTKGQRRLILVFCWHRFQVGKLTKMKEGFGLNGIKTQNRSVLYAFITQMPHLFPSSYFANIATQSDRNKIKPEMASTSCGPKYW